MGDADVRRFDHSREDIVALVSRGAGERGERAVDGGAAATLLERLEARDMRLHAREVGPLGRLEPGLFIG